MKPLRLTLALLIVLLATVGTAAADNTRNFVAHLSGDEEVPAVATLAQGQAIFHLSEDGSELHFKLIVANITNVVAAHIHVAPAGVNGPVVAFLYGPAAPGGGLSNGGLGTRATTARDT